MKTLLELTVLALLLTLSHCLNFGSDMSDWLETENLGAWSVGSWATQHNCPSGSFVNGYGIQTNEQGEVTSLSFECSQLNSTFNIIPKKQIELGAKASINYIFSHFATGFSFQSWTDGQGERFVGGRVIRFPDQKIESTFPPGTTDMKLTETLCRDGWAICGVQGKVLRNAGSTILTKLRIRCCYFCIPEESLEVLRDYTNPGSTDYNLQLKKSFGSRVETSHTTGGSTSINEDTQKEKTFGTTNQINQGLTATDTINRGASSSVTQNAGWDLRFGNSSQTSETSNEDRGVRAATSLGRSSEQNNSSKQGTSSGAGTTKQTGRDTRDSRGSSSSDSRKNCVSKSSSSTSSQTTGESHGQHESSTTDVRAEAGFSMFGVSASVSTGHSSTSGTDHRTTSEKTKSETTGQEESKCSESSTGTSRETSVSQREDNSVNVHWGTEAEQMATQSQSQSRTFDKSLDHRKGHGLSQGQDTNFHVGQNGGNSSTNENSLNRGKTLALEQAVQNSAQKIFLSRSGNSKSTHANWANVQTASWTQEREELDTFICEARHRCVLKQVVGTCGVLTVRTETFIKEIEKLEPNVQPDKPQEKVVDPLEINHEGEVWKVVKNMSFFEASGVWGPYEKCPSGAIVTGYQFKTVMRYGMTGVRLKCTQIGTTLEFSSIKSAGSNRGWWRKEILAKQEFGFAIGYGFARSFTNDTRWIGNHEFVFGGEDRLGLPQWATNSTTEFVQCPPDHAICGLRTMLDKTGNVITNIGFKCCPHCVPEQKLVTRHSIRNEGSTPITNRFRVVVGVDLNANNQQRESKSVGNSVDSAGINVQGLQAGFAARFGSSSNKEFDWSRTSATTFNNLNETTLEYECEPWYLCSYDQLVGTCGSVEISTPYSIKSSISLGDPNQAAIEANRNRIHLEDHETTFEVIQNGQLWMEMPLGLHDSQGGFRNSKYLSCPLGSFITSARYQQPLEMGVSAVSFNCSRINTASKYQFVKELKVGTEDLENLSWMNLGKDGDAIPTIGFYYAIYNYSEDSYGQGPLQLLDDPDEPDEGNLDWPEQAHSVEIVKVTCPPSYKLCGVQATIDDGNMGSISNLKLRCCYHCEPREKWNTLNSLTNSGRNERLIELKYIVVGTKQHAVTTARRALDQQHLEQAGMILDERVTGSLRKIFSSRFADSNESHFDWTSTPTELWTKEKTQSSSYSCEGYHMCRYRQLVGECGDYEVATEHFEQQSKLKPRRNTGDEYDTRTVPSQ